ncbi:LysR family transcriptional regulator [Curvivirga sp.]|uniref:LysR family transcriptional regulator n=1 Tax=Curvivirga sp. TaxID=2856848 RepID=UPI003B5A18F1
MNLYFVKTFLEVVAAGNLVQAADRLNVTQSTVTTRINSLEELLGQKLLIRSRSGVELTSAGFKFQRYAELLIQTWKQANYELSLPSGYDNICNLGCHMDLWNEVGDYFLEFMRNENPNVAISIWSGSEKEITHWLDTGLVDLAFSFEDTLTSTSVATPLFADELILISTNADQIGINEDDYVYVDMGPEIRRQHAEVFSEEMNSGSLISTPGWALDYILKFGGSAYLPRRLASKHLQAELIYEVGNCPSFYRQSFVINNLHAKDNWPWLENAIHKMQLHLKQ